MNFNLISNRQEKEKLGRSKEAYNLYLSSPPKPISFFLVSIRFIYAWIARVEFLNSKTVMLHKDVECGNTTMTTPWTGDVELGKHVTKMQCEVDTMLGINGNTTPLRIGRESDATMWCWTPNTMLHELFEIHVTLFGDREMRIMNDDVDLILAYINAISELKTHSAFLRKWFLSFLLQLFW